MSAPTLLLLDDDDYLRTAIAGMLAKAGYRVQAASDLAHASELVSQATFDVILADVLLQESDSMEFIRLARRKQPGARIVAMSGGGEFLRPGYCLELAQAFGADARLAKPFMFEELVAAVNGAACPQDDSEPCSAP